MAKFSKGEAISFGWGIAKKNFWFFAGLLVIVGVIRFIFGALYNLSTDSALSFLLWAMSLVVSTIISIGLVKISLKIHDGQKAEYQDLFSSYGLFLKFLLASALYGLISLAGFILLIVPGIIWSIKFQFFPYFVIDKGMDPVASLKESAKITKGNKWNLFLFGILLGLINLLGVIVVFIGLFWAVPTTMIAMVFVYRKLSAQMESPSAVSPQIPTETNPQ